jgi:hypothetical protein
MWRQQTTVVVEIPCTRQPARRHHLDRIVPPVFTSVAAEGGHGVVGGVGHPLSKACESAM